MAMEKVNVSTTSVKLVDANAARSALSIANPDSLAIIYISDSGEATTNDFPIFPKTTIHLSFNEGIDVKKKLTAISDTTSKNLRVWEHFVSPEEQPETPPDVQEPNQWGDPPL